MKVTEAIGEEEEVLYYYIRTDIGSSVGSTFPNKTPIDGDEEVTLEDAKKTATLWAASRDLLEALEGLTQYFAFMFKDPKFREYTKAIAAINKAKGL